MSEDVAAPVEGVTAGTLLRQAREAAGLHVATLAANLKVPVRKLEALEEDRYDLLPDAVFVRALASSVCRTLKVDPQPVLERLPQTAQPRLVQDREGINTPFRAPGDGPSPGWVDQVTRPVALTVIALLLGALVIIFLPVAQRGYETVKQANTKQPEAAMPPATEAAAVPPEARPVDTPAPGTEAMPAAASPAPGASAAPAPAVAAASAPVATAAAARPGASAAPSTAAVASTAAASAASAASGVIVFRTRGASWVQVTDAKGATVLRRLMAAGESAGANGTPPLSVTVGDAAQTDVTVRGQPFNLAPVSRDNVARFEVK